MLEEICKATQEVFHVLEANLFLASLAGSFSIISILGLVNRSESDDDFRITYCNNHHCSNNKRGFCSAFYEAWNEEDSTCVNYR